MMVKHKVPPTKYNKHYVNYKQWQSKLISIRVKHKSKRINLKKVHLKGQNQFEEIVS